jgi:HEAT repeat protein
MHKRSGEPGPHIIRVKYVEGSGIHMAVFLGLFRRPDICSLEMNRDIVGLGRILTHEKSRELRCEAAAALGRIGDERSLSLLLSALVHEEEEVRMFAAEALGDLGDHQAVEPLISALGDNDHMVRVAAAEALGKLNDTRAIKPLKGIISDTYEEVRQAAETALDNIVDE